MRLPLPENHLVTLLRRCYSSPKCLPSHTAALRTSRRSFATTVSRRQADVDSTPARNEHDSVAIIGGGVTGLVAARELLRVKSDKPLPKIDLYESTDYCGGWVKSSAPRDVEGGQVVFEYGPRTLRPHTLNGRKTVNLAYSLGLQDQIVITPKSSPAAKSRYIYYPDHLVQMPGPGRDFYDMAWGLLTEPVFKGLASSLIGERFRPERKEVRWEDDDESIGSFLTRRFGSSAIADNIVSAVLHGIYAGDIYQLSARSLMPALYEYEFLYGSVAAGFAKVGNGLVPARDFKEKNELLCDPLTKETGKAMKNASVYSFTGGMSTLTEALESDIEGYGAERVSIKTGTGITNMGRGSEGKVKLTSTNKKSGAQKTKEYKQVISTVAPNALAGALTASSQDYHRKTLQDHLYTIPNVSVMVVNLYYDTPHVHNVQGFGYLIPRSVPYNQNPEMALGVVFDSDSAPIDTAPGTKLTVMLGGHYWSHLSSSEMPSVEEGIAMAKSVVGRHLKITEEPAVARAVLNENCIPQYTVGHARRVRDIYQASDRAFGGKLELAGAWLDGVGLNDCVRSGMQAAKIAAGNLGLTPRVSLAHYRGGRMKWLVADEATRFMKEEALKMGKGGSA